MIQLRDYQSQLLADVRARWAEGYRAPLAVLPTGGGKTVCFASALHDHAGYGAAIAHRREIVGQISQALARTGLRHRIVAPASTIKRIRARHYKEFGKSFVDPHAPAGVVSVQTLASKASQADPTLQAWVRQLTLAVLDEGHHYVRKGQWGRAVDTLAHARLLLVTATPERADGLGLGVHADGYADVMVEGPAMADLIQRGYLSRYVYKAPETDLNMADVPLTADGDLNMRVMRERVVESHLVGDVVRHYQSHAPGRRAIVFSTDVATAQEQADAFNAAGIPAAALSGDTDAGERDRVLDAFERGDIPVLVNVDLFDEGFDVPAVDCVVLARPTESLGKFLQMVGRGLRVLPGKDRAIVLDCVRNWERHGMPDWPRRWTLDGLEKGARRGVRDTVPQKVCTACTQPYEAYHKACPYCGHVLVPAERSKPEHVDGDLVELDSAALAELLESRRRANLPPDEYAVDQIRRGIPPVGRGADMRRHTALLYRRRVLDNLIGWWVGTQEATGRDMPSIHRRFYHRFGVDIVTAGALPADQTDALINTITRLFHEDMRT